MVVNGPKIVLGWFTGGREVVIVPMATNWKAEIGAGTKGICEMQQQRDAFTVAKVGATTEEKCG